MRACRHSCCRKSPLVSSGYFSNACFEASGLHHYEACMCGQMLYGMHDCAARTLRHEGMCSQLVPTQFPSIPFVSQSQSQNTHHTHQSRNMQHTRTYTRHAEQLSCMQQTCRNLHSIPFHHPIPSHPIASHQHHISITSHACTYMLAPHFENRFPPYPIRVRIRLSIMYTCYSTFSDSTSPCPRGIPP